MQKKFILSQFRRPEVGNQGVSRANFFLRAQRGMCSMSLSWILVVASNPWCYLTPIFASIITWPSSCWSLSLCPNFLLLTRTSGIWDLLLFIRSVVSNSATPWTAAHQASYPSLSPGVCSNSCPLSQWCHPQPSHLLSPLLLLPSIFPSIRVFSNELALCIRWPRTGASASASVPPMNIRGWLPLGLTGLISLLFKSLLQHHSSKAPVLLTLSAFFMVQLSYPYMTTGKTITLAIWAFVSKVMSQLLNTLSRFVIAFRAQYDLILMLWHLQRDYFQRRLNSQIPVVWTTPCLLRDTGQFRTEFVILHSFPPR